MDFKKIVGNLKFVFCKGKSFFLVIQYTLNVTLDFKLVFNLWFYVKWNKVAPNFSGKDGLIRARGFFPRFTSATAIFTTTPKVDMHLANFMAIWHEISCFVTYPEKLSRKPGPSIPSTYSTIWSEPLWSRNLVLIIPLNLRCF